MKTSISKLPAGLYRTYLVVVNQELPVWEVWDVAFCREPGGDDVPDAKQVRKDFKKDASFRAKLVKMARGLIGRMVEKNHVSLYKALHPDGELIKAAIEELPIDDGAYSFPPKKGDFGYYLSITPEGRSAHASGAY